MPELLIELFSEEIPARMQSRAADDLKRLVTKSLTDAGLSTGETRCFSTPQRLALVIDDVPSESPARSEERKGPRVGAPEKALAGFLKATGLETIDQAEVVSDPKKGDYYLARIDRPGRSAQEIIAESLVQVVNNFPWPKSMRWGTATFQWVRPLHSVLCLFDGEVVPLEVAGISAGAETRGHRFLSNKPFKVKNFADYQKKLEKHYVILDPARREEIIAKGASKIVDKANLELVEDQALVEENAGLTEWPVVLKGTFDSGFLSVPPECLTTAMKLHQKCFATREPDTGKLANTFLLVSNLEAVDGGKQIVSGNEKVIRARLSDASFFWSQDLKRPLDEMATDLTGITFHDKLGSQRARVERIAELAHYLSGAADANPEDARRAAQLAKADLVSGMVGEFPELQGLMGRYYAEAAGAKPEIARALELHYKPKGPSDSVPLEEDGDTVAIAVALADKFDTLVGFWAIDERPTGSGDPYQLRRAALGIIRIILENDLRISLRKVIAKASEIFEISDQKLSGDVLADSLIAFFADRLKVHLRESGRRYDLIDAVFALAGQDDLALIVKRVEALDELLNTDDGANLLAGVKRAANILAIEEKKDKTSYSGAYDVAPLSEKEEAALAAAIESVRQDAAAAIEVENFAGAMRALAELRSPVDRFFDAIRVNDDDPKVRINRLRMLSQIRDATQTVADFSKIAS